MPPILLWPYALWAYMRVPHVNDVYNIVNHSAKYHQPESTAMYLFGFVVVMTLASGSAAYLVAGYSTRDGRGDAKRFGFSLITILIFSLGALSRLHALRSFYNF